MLGNFDYKVQNRTRSVYRPSTSKHEGLKSCTLEMSVVNLKMKKKMTVSLHRALACHSQCKCTVSVYFNECVFSLLSVVHVNPSRKQLDLSHLKTQSVQRSKHSLPRLQKPIK
jgi:hypothetical protein